MELNRRVTDRFVVQGEQLVGCVSLFCQFFRTISFERNDLTQIFGIMVHPDPI